jgi:iron-sulfur cluster repair protein YtfE (RIC family)
VELQSKIKRYRSEHDQILRFLKQWEEALLEFARADALFRTKSLAQLSEMETQLTALVRHCQEEEEEFDARSQHLLDDRAMEHLQNEHEQLRELTGNYKRLLRVLYATPPTRSLVELGQQLVAHLRRHIAYEEGLLKQIEDGQARAADAARVVEESAHTSDRPAN